MSAPYLFESTGLSLRPFSVILFPEFCFTERFVPSLCTGPELGGVLEDVLIVEARLAAEAIILE